MTAARLRATLDLLGMSARRLGDLTGYSESAVRNWTGDKARVPKPIGLWLERHAAHWQANPPPKRMVRALRPQQPMAAQSRH